MKKKYLGYLGAKSIQIQALKRDFEVLQIKDGEFVAIYFRRTMEIGRPTEITNKMRCHGKKIKGVTIVQKIMHFMMQGFNDIFFSIEESKDVDKLSLDEL